MSPEAKTPVEQLSHGGGPVRLVQLTDSHLCEERGGKLLGMDTDHSLQAVIGQALKERGEPDALLLTGDLSDHGSISAYRRMDDYSRQMSQACFWLPGNHDDRGLMEAAGLPPACLTSEIQIANWQIVMLDSQVPGAVGGELGEAQLLLLADALARAEQAGFYTLVCLHHHPVLIGSAWLDEQIVADAEAFFSLIDQHSGVRGVLWGHIHQQIDRDRNGVALMATPSTCVQFAPGSEAFRADDMPPGYRWLELGEDGTLTTGVSRVEGVAFSVDLASRGYL